MTTFLARIRHKLILFRDNHLFRYFPWIEEVYETKWKRRYKAYYSSQKKRWMYESYPMESDVYIVPVQTLSKKDRITAYNNFQNGKCVCLHSLFVEKNKDTLCD